MLITTITRFIQLIPTAADTEWSAIEPFMQEAEDQLKFFFMGDDLYEYLETVNQTSSLKKIADRLLALKAYENAIPFVDLMQTENGFAVVSSSNLAPASKERVQKLIDWVSAQILVNSDLFIQSVMSTPEALTQWTKFGQFNDITNCLFIYGFDFARCTGVTGSARKALEEAKNDLLAWQSNILEKVISAAYMQQLIAETRTNSVSEASKKVINYCKMILAQLYKKNAAEADKLCNALGNLLDSDLNTYTVYAQSAEYALKTTAPYENKAEHPTFFFG